MAYASPSAWYSNFGNGTSTGYYAVNAWATGVSTPPGTLIRQATTPTVGNERVFVSAPLATDTASHSTGTEPVWTVTKGAQNTDGSIHWQECTGQPGLNGDTTNSPQWTTGSTPSLGLVIYDPTSGSLQICSTSGAGGSVKPTFSATAGTVTTDTSAKWTSLGLASGFSIWKAPFARIQSAVATNWMAANGVLFVSAAHAETQAAAMSLAIVGAVSATPYLIYCVANAPTTTPPSGSDVTTGASMTTTGNNSITLDLCAYWYGLTITAGNGANATNLILEGPMRFDSCALVKGGTTGTISAIWLNGATIELNNTTLQFGATTDHLYLGNAYLRWKNTLAAIAGAIIPTTLFSGASGASLASALIEGVDLSAITGTICGAVGSPKRITFNDCKFAANVTVAATPTAIDEIVQAISSDSAGTNYQNRLFSIAGTMVPSTTVARTGGAVLGTTPISWNLATTATAKWIFPLECPGTWINNTTVGSPVAVIIYGIWFGAALPNNDQVWHDVEYYGSGSTPLASLGTGTKANNLASGSAWAADTSAWDSKATARLNSTVYAVGNIFSQSGSPGSLFIVTAIGSAPHQSAASPPAGYTSATDGASFADGNLTVQAAYRFKMSVSVTPQLAGYLYTYVKAALASSTFYIDP